MDNKIFVDRTILNFKLANIPDTINKEYISIIDIMSEIIRKEIQNEKPIMNIELSTEQVEILFTKKEIEKFLITYNS